MEENTAAADHKSSFDHVADTTVPSLDGYTLDIEARTLTLHFNEPVIISSFNASCIQLQEDLKSTDGQYHRLVDSYAVDTSLHDSSAVSDLEIAFSDYDYDTINGLESRLAKVESAVRMTMDACAALDVAGQQSGPHHRPGRAIVHRVSARCDESRTVEIYDRHGRGYCHDEFYRTRILWVRRRDEIYLTF